MTASSHREGPTIQPKNTVQDLDTAYGVVEMKLVDLAPLPIPWILSPICHKILDSVSKALLNDMGKILFDIVRVDIIAP